MCSAVVQANNFRDGVIAYKKGDYVTARTFLIKSLEVDKVSNASHILGKIYLHGKGVEADTNKAIKYFEFAQKFGNIIAGCYASSAYMDKGVVSWGILEDGLAKGLMNDVAFCIKVVDRWQNKIEFEYSH